MSSLACSLAQFDSLIQARPRSALRAEVSQWLDSSSAARVTHFGRIYPGAGRYVCIGGRKQGRDFALYFFHHGIDDWRVYPPSGVGPSIVYWSADSAMAAPARADSHPSLARTKKCRDRIARIAAAVVESKGN